MAKKKTTKKDATNSSKVNLSGDNVHPIHNIYKLLARMEIIKSTDDLVVPYDANGAHLSIAIPGIKFGIAFEGDLTEKLEADGWHIQKIAYRDVESFSRVYFSIEAARVADLYSRADPNVKTTSQAEERIFSEIIRRGLPIPDRNLKFKRDDGTELTTPDFAWEDYRISFFMDGAYWHSVKDDQAIIKEIKNSKEMTDSIVEKRKDKVRKDASIRSELGSMGWIVLACTDEDIETSDGLHDIVDMIERTLRKAEASRQFRENVHVSDDTENVISDLLSGTAEESMVQDIPLNAPESILSDQNTPDDQSPIEDRKGSQNGAQSRTEALENPMVVDEEKEPELLGVDDFIEDDVSDLISSLLDPDQDH